MIDQIKQVPDYQTKSPEQIADYLSETVTIPNIRGWTPSAMEKEGHLSGSEVDLLLETLRLAGGRGASAFQWLSTTTEGLEFGSDERQAMIDLFALGGQWESLIPGMTSRVKGLGRLIKTRWELLGGVGSVPVTEDLAEGLSAAKRQLLVAAYKSQIDQALNQIGTSEQNLAVATFRAIADELEV